MSDFVLFLSSVSTYLRGLADVVSRYWILGLFFVILVFDFIVDHLKGSDPDLKEIKKKNGV